MHDQHHGEDPQGAAGPAHCQNCAAAMSGPYCGFCGQRALRLNVSLRELLHEGFHEFVHLDRRILVTLRLLFARPGRLTAEMLMGRRQRYISPIRLYLLASLVFFVLLAGAFPAPKPATDVSNDPQLAASADDDRFELNLKKGIKVVAGDPAAFTNRLWNRAPKVAFFLVPAFALMTCALFRRRLRFFVPHFYFALHFHSFIFLTGILVLLLHRWIPVVTSLWAISLPVYLVLAARTTFEARAGEALWKTLLVCLGYALLLSSTAAALIILSLVWA